MCHSLFVIGNSIITLIYIMLLYIYYSDIYLFSEMVYICIERRSKVNDADLTNGHLMAVVCDDVAMKYSRPSPAKYIFVYSHLFSCFSFCSFGWSWLVDDSAADWSRLVDDSAADWSRLRSLIACMVALRRISEAENTTSSTIF